MRPVEKWPFFVAGGVALLVGIGALVPNPQQSATPSAAAIPRGNWDYDQHRDAVHNGEVAIATTLSRNTETLHSPYGPTNVRLMVEQHPRFGLNLVIKASDGQIVCGIESCRAAINIDGRAETLALHPSADGDPKMLFTRLSPALLARLKSSRHVIVELPFYQDGLRQFTFDTAGLQWPPTA